MTKREIIQFLKPFPEGVELYFASSDGCNECNEDGLTYIKPITSIVFMPKGNYPHEDLTEYIQLE